MAEHMWVAAAAFGPFDAETIRKGVAKNKPVDLTEKSLFMGQPPLLGCWVCEARFESLEQLEEECPGEPEDVPA